MTVNIQVEFEIGQMVYLLTDMDQLPCMVVAYEVLPNELVKYKVNTENYSTTFYGFEISETKTVF